MLGAPRRKRSPARPARNDGLDTSVPVFGITKETAPRTQPMARRMDVTLRYLSRLDGESGKHAQQTILKAEHEEQERSDGGAPNATGSVHRVRSSYYNGQTSPGIHPPTVDTLSDTAKWAEVAGLRNHAYTP